MDASGELIAWTIMGVLAFPLIGLPVLYGLYLTFAADPRSFERSVRDVEQFTAVNARTGAYLWPGASRSIKES
jgi:type IV secretory pathway VirB3-like protein